MVDVILFSAFDIYLIGIATILLLITVIQYFGLAKRKENPTEKSIVNAYAWMFIFLTIYLILLNLSFFYLEGKYIGHIYWGNFENPSLIYVWLAKGAYIFSIAAFIYYFYTYEKILNKRIHLATFAVILIIILIIFLPYELVMNQLFPIAFTILGVYLMHTFFALMKKSQKELRAATSFIILGSRFMVLFLAYMSPTLKRLGDTPILIFPALLIFGTFLCMSPTIFKPEFFTRNIKYWYLFSIILIGAQAINLIYLVSFIDMIELILISLVFLIFFFVECIFLIRFIKREESLGIEGEIGVRGIFTKPEEITEEEISISKEKKICLVCKGDVSGINYICTECGAFYCMKCSKAIIDLENACWACDTQIDESKPVKPYEKVEEDVKIEISEKPQKKPKTKK